MNKRQRASPGGQPPDRRKQDGVGSRVWYGYRRLPGGDGSGAETCQNGARTVAKSTGQDTFDRGSYTRNYDANDVRHASVSGPRIFRASRRCLDRTMDHSLSQNTPLHWGYSANPVASWQPVSRPVKRALSESDDCDDVFSEESSKEQ